MSFFTDVIQKHPAFHAQGRYSQIDLLEPETRRKVQAILSDAKAHGVELHLFETYRSQERQRVLFDQHATQLRTVGVHHYGLAADIVYWAGGEPSWKGDFTLLAHLAKAHGLVSGMDWGRPGVHHSFVDSDHVQRCSIADQARLFRGDWYPDATYDPYR